MPESTCKRSKKFCKWFHQQKEIKLVSVPGSEIKISLQTTLFRKSCNTMVILWKHLPPKRWSKQNFKMPQNMKQKSNFHTLQVGRHPPWSAWQLQGGRTPSSFDQLQKTEVKQTHLNNPVRHS